MATSILDKVKNQLDVDGSAFDDDIITAVNAALSRLRTLGVGPEENFVVVDSAQQWETYIGTDEKLAELLPQLQIYVKLKTKMFFDPPQTSFAIEATKNMIAESEWIIKEYGAPIVVSEETTEEGA